MFRRAAEPPTEATRTHRKQFGHGKTRKSPELTRIKHGFLQMVLQTSATVRYTTRNAASFDPGKGAGNGVGERNDMFDHPIIDVALGLVLFYIVLSLVVSAVQEWVASLFGLRAKNLRAGLENLIDGPGPGAKFARMVYDHPLVKNMARAKKLPSYIAPETLSTVLLEVVAKDRLGKSYSACSADELRDLVEKIEATHPMRGVLEVFVDRAEDVQEKLKQKVAEWFDEGMTRVSGWYRRAVKLRLVIIAGIVAMLTNASTVHVASELWTNDALRTTIAQQAVEVADEGTAAIGDDSLEQLQSFPIGWRTDSDGDIILPDGWLAWIATLIGWLITVAAVSLGAPFWFDLLGKVANLRGSGGKSQRPASG